MFVFEVFYTDSLGSQVHKIIVTDMKIRLAEYMAEQGVETYIAKTVFDVDFIEEPIYLTSNSKFGVSLLIMYAICFMVGFSIGVFIK